MPIAIVSFSGCANPLFSIPIGTTIFSLHHCSEKYWSTSWRISVGLSDFIFYLQYQWPPHESFGVVGGGFGVGLGAGDGAGAGLQLESSLYSSSAPCPLYIFPELLQYQY